MPTSAWVIDVTPTNFREILERSRSVPVLLDFWAPWCGPCKQLSPTLEKLAKEEEGRFLLAKVNTEQHPRLAAQFGIQSIPHVMAVVDGQVRDHFVGNLPEPQIREFLDKIAPDSTADLVKRAREADDPKKATLLWNQILQLDPENEEARLFLARRALAEGSFDLAGTHVEAVLDAEPDHEEAKEILEMIERARGLEESGGLGALREAVKAAPDDPEALYELAEGLSLKGEYEKALEMYLESAMHDMDWNDQAARKGMLKLFNLLGQKNPLTKKYRTRLANILF